MTSRTTHSKRPFVIAEIALSHDGSLGMAHAFIDAAAQAGADAVKFQTHIAVAKSTFDEPFRIAFSVQDSKRYDYWRRTEFTAVQWLELAAHAERCGIHLSQHALLGRGRAFVGRAWCETLEGAIGRAALSRFA